MPEKNEFISREKAAEIPILAEKKRITRWEIANHVDKPYQTMTQYYGKYNQMPKALYDKVMEYIDNFQP